MPILILSLLVSILVYIIYKQYCLSENKDTLFQKYLIKRRLNSFPAGKKGEFHKKVINDILSLPIDGWAYNYGQLTQKGFLIQSDEDTIKYYISSYNITSFKIYYKDNYILKTTNIRLYELFHKIEELNIVNNLEAKYSYKEGRTEDTQEVFSDLEKIKNHTKEIEQIRQKYDKKHKKLYK